MAKIIHDKSGCIGCGTCVALCPKYFEMESGGKAHLKGSKLKKGQEELEVDQITKELKDAVDACPVQVIKIVK